ncbi:3-isopropylmalate dehydratase large subunit [bacterium]|nr:3-isopropylmalate dehydratase large subunit [bacterium]
MEKTLIEKILENKTGVEVKPGDFIEIEPDVALANDITAPLAITEFRKTQKPLFAKDRLILVQDHFVPAKDIRSANQARMLFNFAREYDLKYYFEVGRGGIEHALLPEEGLVLPGDVVIGADSHTCTYGGIGAFATGVGSTDIAFFMATDKCWLKVPESMRFVFSGKLNPYVLGKDLILYTIGKIGVDGALYKSMEFTGDAIKSLSVDSRLSLCNMAIEAGGKCGMIEPDEVTSAYIKEKAKRDYKIYKADKDAEYSEVFEFDCKDIEPQVALPHLPSNTVSVRDIPEIQIDQVVIGSCTNGRLEDLRIAGSILKDHKVHKDVRLIVIPATQRIYKSAIAEGLIDIFIDAGAVVSTPTCGPCLGGYMGILADGEKCLATTNRNFKGRMGSQKAEVYLANPAVAAASAILGKIAHPDEVLK